MPTGMLPGSSKAKTDFAQKTSHGNAGVWKAWKAKKPAFYPSHTPWKSLRDSHITTATTATIMYLKTGEARNQSHSHLKGLVNHVPGLKRKGCPGTLERGHG
jgi:hypothetical protein